MLLWFLRSFRVYFQSRADLQTEIVALRHQTVALQRQIPRPRLKPVDRRFWVALSLAPNMLVLDFVIHGRPPRVEDRHDVFSNARVATATAAV